MNAPASTPETVTRHLPDEAATARLGEEISLFARAGDWILLSGDLGSGKTTLARALIRALAPAHGAFEVPSPTFTLVQPYDFTRIPVAHVDLYRIADAAEVHELGLDDLARDHLLLVEWPDRLPRVPDSCLHVHLADAADGGRVATLRGTGEWRERLKRMEAVRDFLAALAGEAEPPLRRFLQGDASSRRYERVTLPGRPPAILMDMPARPDGPPLRDGRSYDELVHLARSARAVWAIDTLLRARGFSAPAILAADLDAGLLLLEDLGDAVFGRLYEEGRMEEPLAAATDLLAAIATREWPRDIETPAGVHHLADYDDEAFIIEAELLLDWFWPHFRGAPPDETARRDYRALWRGLLAKARVGPPVLVLRDYHSPNLIWLEDRERIARVGLIDTQDAVLGPAAYDLASLLQDARFTIPPAMEEAMLAHYVAARRATGPDFDEAAFRTAYAVMGTQRAAKVLGIFVRLLARDGKPAYMRHLPRVRGYLARNLAHPALAPLAAWLRRHLPEALEAEEEAPPSGAGRES